MSNEEKERLWNLSVLNVVNKPPCEYKDNSKCNCAYNGKCIRKDNNSNVIGVCWMKTGQGEY